MYDFHIRVLTHYNGNGRSCHTHLRFPELAPLRAVWNFLSSRYWLSSIIHLQARNVINSTNNDSARSNWEMGDEWKDLSGVRIEDIVVIN